MKTLAGYIIILCMGSFSMNAQVPDMYFRQMDVKDGLPFDASIQQVLQDSLGKLWIAYDKGLYIYDGYNITSFPPNTGDSTSLAEVFVRALHLAGDGRIWAGTRNRGISIYDPVTEQFSQIRVSTEGGPLPIQQIWDFYEDESGILWMAAYPGLIRHDPHTGIYEHFLFERKGYSAMQIDYLNDTRKILQDPTNADRLFVATRGGLLAFDRKTREFTHHRMPYFGPDQLNYLINDFLFENDTIMWMGTWSGYVVKYNTQDEQWSQYTDPEDASGYGIIRTIQRKGKDELWVVGTPGFGVFNMRSGDYDYYEHDPAASRSIGNLHIPGSMIFTRDSTLFVFSRTGTSVSDPYPGYDAQSETFKPYLSEILVNGNSQTLDTSAAMSATINIGEGANTLEFEVTWPVFQDPNDALYRFKMEGLDTDWKSTGHGRIIQYTNVKGGKYHLRFQAGRDGIYWNEGLTSPVVDIHIPLLDRPLIQVTLIALFLAGAYLLYWLRVRHMMREKEREEKYRQKLSELEMSALRAQMNPHFMFNALNSIKNFILKEDTESADRYLTKFSRLMRTILRNSKSRLVSLEDEIEALKLYVDFESMRFRDKINAEWDIDESLDLQWIYVPPLIMQPFVENAIWHGLMQKEGQGNLYVSIHNSADQLLINIRDDGVGRQKAQEMKSKSGSSRKSYGMQITSDRIALVRQTMEIEADVKVVDLVDSNGHPDGTEVIIRLPLISDPKDKNRIKANDQ